jgi:phosphoribosylformimino-5-aminoimidazole carboxamide ribotide isomerase
VRIVPAIDIRGGKCVRLVQGDYSRETVFGEDPAAMARRWIENGARALHLVDLDGARSGNADNRAAVEAIIAAVPSDVEIDLGGGIRDEASVDAWLDAGLHHVILGTAAVERPELVSTCARRHPGRVWVGIDARAGKVAVAGWTRTTTVSATELALDAEARGAGGIVYTDIERDGTGRGVNVDATRRLAEALTIEVYASGGVRSAADVVRLRDAEAAGVSGVIVGRALYDGSATLGDLIEAAR